MSQITRRILFAGAYGIRNSGDDLPLITLCEGLRSRNPEVDFEFVALSRHPDPWEVAQYGVRMVKNIEYDSPEAARGRWFLGCNPEDDTSALEDLKREIREADLLVLGAGNALIDITIGFLRGPIPLMALYGFLAKLYRTPVMIYGMSIGPLHTEWGRDLSRGLLEASDIITVRDRASAQLCREDLKIEHPIHVLPDATLLSVPNPRSRAEELLIQEGIELPDKRIVALGLRDLARACGTDYADRLEQAIDGLIEKFSREVFYLFVPQSLYYWDDDRLIAERLARKYPPTVAATITGRYHPLDLAAFYRLADVTLAVRLHAAVFSALAETPVVAINYLPKVRGFMTTVGFEHRCIELDSISYKELHKQIYDLLDDASSERDNLRRQIPRLRDAAQCYVDEASRALFDAGSSERTG